MAISLLFIVSHMLCIICSMSSPPLFLRFHSPFLFPPMLLTQPMYLYNHIPLNTPCFHHLPYFKYSTLPMCTFSIFSLSSSLMLSSSCSLFPFSPFLICLPSPLTTISSLTYHHFFPTLSLDYSHFPLPYYHTFHMIHPYLVFRVYLLC